MKTAAAFAAIVAVAVYITTDEIQATPSLRSLRSTTENQPLHEDESSKGHHHKHIKKVVKKVTKIAIPVPVGVPQYIPVPINVPSPVVASSNTAVVSSSNNAVIGTSTAAVGAGGPSSGLVTPAPTTFNGQTAVTPAPTTPASTIPASMIPASATPAPTNLANANTGNGQLSAIPVPGTQNGDLRATEMPTFSNVGGNNNVVGGGLNIGARNTLPVNSGGIARGFGNGNPINGFSAANQMGAFGSEMSTNRGANMNGRLNRNEVGGFGQPMGFGTQKSNTLGGFSGSNINAMLGQGNNEFINASGGFGRFGFESHSSGISRRVISNSAFERNFHRHEHQRRRRL